MEDIFSIWQKIFRRTAKEAIFQIVKVAARDAQKSIITWFGISKGYKEVRAGKRGVKFGPWVPTTRKDTPAAAIRQREKWLKYWIIGLGLPKRRYKSESYRSLFKRALPKDQRKAYFENAKAYTGRIAARLNEAILWAKTKPVHRKIYRHGKYRSKMEIVETAIQTQAKLSFNQLKTENNAVTQILQKSTAHARRSMEKAVMAKLKRDLEKMQKKFTIKI